MTGTAFQKADNRNHSMINSLFRSESNAVPKAYHLASAETRSTPSFNIGDTNAFDSHSNRKVQTKLKVNQPGDKYENEADAIAEKIMKMEDRKMKPAIPVISNEADRKKIKRKEKSQRPVQADSALDSYVNKLGSSGSPLSSSTRDFFESRFASDFSNVRIHTGREAAQSAESIGARAYTTGNHIVFNDGQYAPASEHGKRLLAHELAHVIQQRRISEPSIMRWTFNKVNKVIEEDVKSDGKLIEVYINDFELPAEKGDVKAIYDKNIEKKQLASVVDLNDPYNKRTSSDKRSYTDFLVQKWKDRTKWDSINPDTLKKASDKKLYYTIQASLEKKNIKVDGITYDKWENNIDHIIELQLGGSDGEENLQILAKDPNQKSGRDINITVGEIASAYKDEHKNLEREGKQLRILIRSVKVIGDRPEVNGFKFPLEKDIEKIPKEKAKNEGKEYNFIAGANSAKAFFVETKLSGKSYTKIEEDSVSNKSFVRFIPLIKLTEIKGKKGDQLKGEFNPQEGRLPIQITKGEELSFMVDEGRNVNSSSSKKPKAFDFYYPYLSKGKITELETKNGNITGRGKIYPSVKFIKDLDIEFSKDYFRLVKDLDVKSPFKGIRITESKLTASLFPELSAQGSIKFEAGNEKKPLMKAILNAGVNQNGFFAEGDAEFFIPNVDNATGKVSYKKVNDVYALEASLDAKITAKGKKFLKGGDIHANYKDGEISASGKIELDVPNTKNTSIGIDYKNGNWILKGKTVVTIPKLNDVELDIVYDLDKGKLKGTGQTRFKYKSFAGEIKLTYDDGKISGEGTLDVTKGKVKGSARITLNEKGKFSGEGSITVALAKDIEGTAGVHINEEKITVKGQIKVLKPYTIFPKKELNKKLFENSLTIPIPGLMIGNIGVKLEIKFGADFNAGIGPGVLNDVLINATFDPFADDKNPSFTFSTKFDVSAFARLVAYVQASLALDALVADAKGGIRLTGIAQLNANLNVPLVIQFENNVFSIDSQINALIALILALNIEGIIEAQVARGYLGHWEKRWMLKQFMYSPAGARIGMSLPIKYASNKPFVLPGIDDIKITRPEIDAKSMLSDTLRQSGEEKQK